MMEYLKGEWQQSLLLRASVRLLVFSAWLLGIGLALGNYPLGAVTLGENPMRFAVACGGAVTLALLLTWLSVGGALRGRKWSNVFMLLWPVPKVK